MAARGALALIAVLILIAAAHAQEPGEVLYQFPPVGVDMAGPPGTGLRHTTWNVSSTAFADQIVDQGLIARGTLLLPGISSGPGAAGPAAVGAGAQVGAGAGATGNR